MLKINLSTPKNYVANPENLRFSLRINQPQPTMTTTTEITALGRKGCRPTIKPGHSQKNIAAVRRWWNQHRNIWEISQLTGLSTALVTEIQADHL